MASAVGPRASAAGQRQTITTLGDRAARYPSTMAGSPIAGLSKYTAVETSTPGTYGATMPETDLIGLVGSVATPMSPPAYVVVYEGAKVLASDPCTITPAARAG